MTLQRRPTEPGDDSDRLGVEFSRLLCDDRVPPSCRTGAGKSPEICGVDGRTATGLDAESRMRQEADVRGVPRTILGVAKSEDYVSCIYNTV